nr:DUF5074 domain-containing protein [Pedobacter sp. ASV2]
MRNNYKKLRSTGLLSLLVAAMFISSCKKNESEIVPEKKQVITGTKGVYMLCEGLMNGNNSAISYYDFATNTSVQDYFKQVNGRSLGETANDLEAYGSKMYCVVSGIQGKPKSFIEIIDIATGKSLKSISLNSSNDGFMPRFVTFYKNKAYVSRYDGKISRIDTATMAIDAELQLMNGTQKAEGLEGLAVANGKLYVTNSSHPYYPNGLLSKVTVIDLATFTKIKDIEVGHNPVRIAAAPNGDLFTITWMDYNVGNEATFVRISSTTDAVIQKEEYDLGAITIGKNTGWVSKDIYTNPTIKPLDLTTGKIGNNLITDGTDINTIYGLTVNPFDGSVTVADAVNYSPSQGMAYIYGTDGKRKNSFKTAGLPQHAVFVYNYKYE